MISTGFSLRTLREELSLSQAKLAELSGVPQHILSAFELEKTVPSQEILIAISNAIADKSRVTKLVQRRKRYQNHTYAAVRHLPERIRRAVQTSENENYRKQLETIACQHRLDKTRLTALSLFSGCGGFSLGFSAAGFQLKAFLELERDLRHIYKLNFPECVELGGDITQITDSDLRRIPTLIGEVDAIIGGPPCQGFSLSGKRRTDDARNSLFRHYLRFVDALQPKFAVLENVRLLTSMKNERGTLVKDDINTEFKTHGYSLGCFEVNVKNFGVPQHRERVLFVAIREDLRTKPQLPDSTHGDDESNMFSQYEPYRTFGDACSDLKYLESGEQSDDSLHVAVNHPKHVIDWLWNVTEGCSAHDNEDPKLRPPSGYNTTYKRQVWNEPASTVQTTFGMISGCRNVHPIATRALTIREAARIQSFPDNYQFAGNLGAIRTGIGNAVPPLLAYWIGQYAARLIKSCRNNQLQG